MSIETIGWITGVLLLVLGGAGGWVLRGAHEKRAAGMIVGPPPHVPPVRPVPPPTPPMTAPPRPVVPQVARTPARPPSVPPPLRPLRMPTPQPHQKPRRGKHWPNGVVHTEALPVVQPAEEGT